MSEVLDRARADGIVILGAGQAGGRAAEALRGEGFRGSITLIGAEAERPYERPSLSKEMLLDGTRETIAWVHAPEHYEAQDIGLLLRVVATGIDRASRRVSLSDGGAIGFGALIIATGARPRRIEGQDIAPDACTYLRTLEDSRRLRARLAPGSRLLVIGAGFIGLEVAAAAIQRGCSVCVLDVADLPLGRVAPAEVGAFYAALHTERGVSFRFGTQVSAIERRDAQLIVTTAAGEVFVADTIVAGVGVIPNAELAADAGLAVERGIVVDAFGMTTDPAIFAAGDVARSFNPRFGRHIMLESWQNAQNQAIAVAQNIARGDARLPYAEVPWFWSDQYDVNLQITGLAEADSYTIMRGRQDMRSWLLFQLRDDRVLCVIGVNAARELRAARELITMGVEVSPAMLADTGVALPELVRRLKRDQAALSTAHQSTLST